VDAVSTTEDLPSRTEHELFLSFFLVIKPN